MKHFGVVKLFNFAAQIIQSMLKIGVIGAGHLGKIHIKQIKEIPAYQLMGFFDNEPSVCQAVAAELQVKAFSSMEELIKEVDVVDVVVPTIYHFECAKAAIKKSKHVFIEKPLAGTVAEALLITTGRRTP